MVSMVTVGRSKFGQNNRISLVEGLPELLNLSVGDYVLFEIQGGRLILEKDTRKYRGFDFEGDEIRETLLAYEDSKIGNDFDDNLDPDELEQIAKEEYLKDKALKKQIK